MKKLRHFTVVATTAATLLLVGCAGPDGTATADSAAASPDSNSEKTLKEVLSDIRYAAEGIKEGDLRVVPDTHAAELRPLCLAHGTILTPEVPGPTELRILTDRLEKRGWKPDSTVEGIGATATSGKWDMLLGYLPVPEEFAAQAGSNKGAIDISGSRKCEDPQAAG